MKRTLCTVIVAALSVGCIGNRQTVKFDELAYAVSMTPTIYGKDGKIRTEGVGIEVIGDIEIVKTYWSLVYSFVPLGDTKEQVRNFNRVVAARGGEGVILFEVENEGCSFNNFGYLILPATLPFFPGCSRITMRGKIVREVN